MFTSPLSLGLVTLSCLAVAAGLVPGDQPISSSVAAEDAIAAMGFMPSGQSTTLQWLRLLRTPPRAQTSCRYLRQMGGSGLAARKIWSLA